MHVSATAIYFPNSSLFYSNSHSKAHIVIYFSDMRCSICVAALAATVLALPTTDIKTPEETFTIELEEGERRQVTEADKFALKAVS